MARPTIYEHGPMTPAERMRRYRARKANPAKPPRDINESLARMTRKQQARYVNRSVRWWHYLHVLGQRSKIDWADVMDGQHGRIGMKFLAEVCCRGSAEQQEQVHDVIKRYGASAGRDLWRCGRIVTARGMVVMR